MSAFALVWNVGGDQVGDAQIDLLAELLQHRAFDSMQVQRLGEVAIVHARLVTDRESRLDDGLAVDPASGVVVVAAARLDNREVIDRAQAIGAGAARSDPRRLLDWYLAEQPWGKLIGDFAAVVWDPRRRALVAVRDQLGVRPLYHGRVGHTIMVASEIRAFGAIEGAFVEIDEAGLVDRLQRHAELREHTVYKAIRRVPAASSAELHVDHTTVRRYWELDVSRRTTGTFDELAVEARRLVDQAIRCRMGTDGPVAAELSGGLDSSAIVGAAQRLVETDRTLAGRLIAVSLLHPGLRCDEEEYIRAVVDLCGVEWAGFDGTVPLDADYVRREAAFTADVPVYTHLAGHQQMRRHIRESGAAIVLTGQGGDTIFDVTSGYLADLLAGGRLPTLVRHLRRRRAAGWGSIPTSVVRHVVRPALPGWAERLVERARGGYRPPWIPEPAHQRWARQLLTATPAWEIDPLDRAAAFRRACWTPASLAAHFETMDRLGGRVGLEFRHPLFDLRLVEFAAGIDAEVHTDGSRSRRLQRAAFADVYPDEVVGRDSKAEFSATVQIAIEAHLDGEYRLPALEARELVVGTELVARFLMNHEVIEGKRALGVAMHSTGDGLMAERWISWQATGDHCTRGLTRRIFDA